MKRRRGRPGPAGRPDRAQLLQGGPSGLGAPGGQGGPGAPVVDPGNRWAGAEYPGEIVAQRVDTRIGPRVMVTVRHAGTTLSILMKPEDLAAWAAYLEQAAGQPAAAGPAAGGSGGRPGGGLIVVGGRS